MRRSMKLLLAGLSLFEIADGVITNILIEQGIAREGNPLMTQLAGNYGLLLAKIVGALICVALLWRIYRCSPRLAKTCTTYFAIVYALIVLWNLTLLMTA